MGYQESGRDGLIGRATVLGRCRIEARRPDGKANDTHTFRPNKGKMQLRQEAKAKAKVKVKDKGVDGSCVEGESEEGLPFDVI